MASRDGARVAEPVVETMEEAVQLLVQHLVRPVLPREVAVAVAPEKQETVARQVHATVLLYNYYHRKQLPDLPFAEPERFSAALAAANDTLRVYLTNNQVRDGGSQAVGLSATEKAVVEACDVARALDAAADAPDTATWPVAKVAVLLVHPAGKKCLLSHGAVTKGVWSVLEKHVTPEVMDSYRAELSSNNETFISVPYVLQQIAFSVVESNTGMKRTGLRIIEEHVVYSHSKKETTTHLVVMQYDQKTEHGDLKEVPLRSLVTRLSGPIFKRDPHNTTTCVRYQHVDCYDLLPYKDVLLNLFNRSLDSPKRVPNQLPSRKDEILERQEPNSKSNLKKRESRIGVKETGNSDTTRRGNESNKKRKSEVLMASATASTKHRDGESHIEENSTLSSHNVENSVIESTPAANAEVNVPEVDNMMKNDASKVIESSPTANTEVNVPEVDNMLNNDASTSQIVKITKISGSIIDEQNDQMHAPLESLQKMQDHSLHENCMLGDGLARPDMDIQRIMTGCDQQTVMASSDATTPNLKRATTVNAIIENANNVAIKVRTNAIIGGLLKFLESEHLQDLECLASLESFSAQLPARYASVAVAKSKVDGLIKISRDLHQAAKKNEATSEAKRIISDHEEAIRIATQALSFIQEREAILIERHADLVRQTMVTDEALEAVKTEKEQILEALSARDSELQKLKGTMPGDFDKEINDYKAKVSSLQSEAKKLLDDLKNWHF